jgi:hypothetical protein
MECPVISERCLLVRNPGGVARHRDHRDLGVRYETRVDAATASVAADHHQIEVSSICVSQDHIDRDAVFDAAVDMLHASSAKHLDDLFQPPRRLRVCPRIGLGPGHHVWHGVHERLENVQNVNRTAQGAR